MIRYVAGFLFSEDRSHVALIRKEKPAFMAGLLNAIGGKIEPGESATDAMVREFAEETGVTFERWKPTATLLGPDFEVFFFHGFSDVVFQAISMEREIVSVRQVDGLRSTEMMSNLPLLLAIALDQSGIVRPVALSDRRSQSGRDPRAA